MIFDLRSLPDDKNRPRLYLMQMPFKPRGIRLTPVEMPVTMGALDGPMIDRVRPALEALMGAAKVNDYLGNDRSFAVSEDVGLRLLVLFTALSGARASERLQTAVESIMRLSVDDASYWVEKLRNLATLAPEKAERVRRSFFDMIED